MTSTQDKINGTANATSGSIKKTIGRVTGNEKLKQEGEVQKTQGEAQKAMGQLKVALKQGIHSAGDAADSAAKKLEAAGHARLSSVMHKAGEKMSRLVD